MTGTGEAHKGKKRPRAWRVFLVVLYTLSAAFCIYQALGGLSYYLTPYTSRPHLDAYRTLRPGGSVGHGFGVAGGAMLLLLLLYSVRKSNRLLRGAGPVGRWLDIHIYFGIFGPLLIILHTSFKVGGIVAISFWSMVAVALSGVLGRFLYRQIPRNLLGDELGAKEIGAAQREIDSELRDRFHLTGPMLDRIDREARGGARSGGVSLALALLRGDLGLGRIPWRLASEFSGKLPAPSDGASTLPDVIRARALLTRRIALLDRVQRLFHYWHVIHKPFAYTMLIFMIIHVVIAVVLGYRWIWS